MQVLGQIKIGEFSVASTRDEWTMEVTADGEGQAAGKLQAAILTLKEPLFNRLDQFIVELQNSWHFDKSNIHIKEGTFFSYIGWSELASSAEM